MERPRPVPVSADADTTARTYSARNVSKAFSGVPVLEGIDLAFRPGEIHTLVGENGAGKSTLLKIMSGVYSADSGSLELEGEALGPLSPATAQRRGIYLVPQEPRLMPDLSIAENLYLGSLPRGRFGFTVNWKMINNSAGDVLSRVGLSVDPRSLAGRLPLAHQQLLECARALAHGCTIIFFDEPTSPLTSHEAETLFSVMDDLRRQQMTLGFISHRFDEVEELSDRISVMRDGAVVAHHLRGESDRASIINAMVGRELTMAKRKTRPERSGAPILDVRHVVSKPEVEDISIQVRAGEIVGLGGLVGSGRTELSEAVFGLRPSSAGVVTVDGVDVTGRAPQDCIDAGLIYLGEDRGRNGIFADVDLTRNASASVIGRLPRKGRLIRKRQEETMTQGALQNAGVKAANMGLPIKSLSGGNQQKVLLARWMMAQPKVAIFDEPTRGVDVGAKEGIYEMIESLTDDGLATLVISSELDELVRLCDRVYAVYEGRVVGELRGDAITSDAVGQLAVGAA